MFTKKKVKEGNSPVESLRPSWRDIASDHSPLLLGMHLKVKFMNLKGARAPGLIYISRICGGSLSAPFPPSRHLRRHPKSLSAARSRHLSTRENISISCAPRPEPDFLVDEKGRERTRKDEKGRRPPSGSGLSLSLSLSLSPPISYAGRVRVRGLLDVTNGLEGATGSDYLRTMSERFEGGRPRPTPLGLLCSSTRTARAFNPSPSIAVSRRRII
jgi:hypothetical protein